MVGTLKLAIRGHPAVGQGHQAVRAGVTQAAEGACAVPPDHTAGMEMAGQMRWVSRWAACAAGAVVLTHLPITLPQQVQQVQQVQSQTLQEKRQPHSHGGLQQLKAVRLLGWDVLGKSNGPPMAKPVKPAGGCGSGRRLGAERLLRGRLSWRLGNSGWAHQALAAGAPGLSPAAGMRHLCAHKWLPPAGSGGSEP